MKISSTHVITKSYETNFKTKQGILLKFEINYFKKLTKKKKKRNPGLLVFHLTLVPNRQVRNIVIVEVILQQN